MYENVQLLINGVWASSDSGKTLPVVNSATGEPIGTVAHAGIADLDRALAAAARGFQVWSTPPPTSGRRSCAAPPP